MKVSDVMSKKVLSVTPKENMTSVIKKLSKDDITGMPVIDQGKVVGIISNSDVLKGMDVFFGINSASDMYAIKKILKGKDVSSDMARRLCRKKVWEMMSKNVVTIDHDKSLSEAVKIINDNSIDRLPVVHKGKLVGIITKKDVLKAVSKMND